MWHKWSSVYDRLSENQRLAIGVGGVLVALSISGAIIACVVFGIAQFFA
jgi:hypothetical protein